MTESRTAVVDDDPNIVKLIRTVLQGEGFAVDGFLDPKAFLDEGRIESYQVILCDLALGGGWDGIEILREIRKRSHGPKVVIITGHGSIASAVEAMKEGASDYLLKPFSVRDLKRLVQRLVEPVATPQPGESHGLQVGVSAAWKSLLEKARLVADRPTTVLIRGETGTGKEVVARFIASHGPRANAPYITLNCATLPENLVESELFGHVRGAFSGATLPRRGLFEEADGGTLFLDEVGTLPLPAQAKLLRALEEREIRRVGDSRNIHVDVRILAATNLDLAAAIKRNELRADLYYRLSVVTLTIPPLRERPEDIPVLAEHFLASQAMPGKPPPRLSKGALEALVAHPFPGNVRELKHLIESVCAFAPPGSEIAEKDLGLSPRRSAAEAEPVTLESVRETLRKAGGNKLEAARLLGITRSRLYRILNGKPEADGDEPTRRVGETAAGGTAAVSPDEVPEDFES